MISPDSLLLKNVASVQFLVTLLRLLYHPESEELKLQLLFDYLRFKETKDPHLFLSKYVEKPVNTFLADFEFSIELFNQYSLYEGVALAVNCFDLARPSDAYLTHFMDIVFDFKNARKGGLADFLEFWDDQQEKLSISSPEGLNAITVMTVHKSKGLSAPVIIYAFADSKLIDTHTEKLWFPVDYEQFNGFDYLLVNSNKSLVNYNAQAEELMTQLHEQNLLDQLNVLYVAMTRPETFLYVITSLSKSSAETYGTLFKEFLEENGQWNSDVVEYTFGSAVFPKKKEKETTEESPIPSKKVGSNRTTRLRQELPCYGTLTNEKPWSAVTSFTSYSRKSLMLPTSTLCSTMHYKRAHSLPNNMSYCNHKWYVCSTTIF